MCYTRGTKEKRRGEEGKGSCHFIPPNTGCGEKKRGAKIGASAGERGGFGQHNSRAGLRKKKTQEGGGRKGAGYQRKETQKKNKGNRGEEEKVPGLGGYNWGGRKKVQPRIR